MANQQLIDYVKTQTAAGAAKLDIQKAAAGAGWPLPEIESAFAVAEGKVAAPAPSPQAAAVPVQKPAAVQPQAQALPVIHMHPQDGMLRSPWLWSLIVLLLLVGAAAAAYFYTPVGPMIMSYFAPAPAPVVEMPVNEYKDPQGGFSFTYPEGKAPVLKAIWEEEIMGGELSTSTLPAGSVEIPGVAVVSKISLADFATSSSSAIYDYVSCCSGTRYWLDAASSTWKAESISFKDGVTTNKPLALATTTPAGAAGCTLARQIGPYTTYRIKSGDEGVPNLYYYFLLTDKSYALRFMTTADLDATTTDPAILQQFASVVSSLKLIDSEPVVVHCA